MARPMVLRSVYLPEKLDRELRAVAFRNERSKNDLIRQILQAGLKAKLKDGTLPSEAVMVVKSSGKKQMRRQFRTGALASSKSGALRPSRSGRAPKKQEASLAEPL